MFEAIAASESAPAPAWLSTLNGRPQGFAADQRFVAGPRAQASADLAADRAQAQREAESQHALAEAFEAGFAKGRSEGDQRLVAEQASFERLRLSIARLDEVTRRDFSDRLAQTVIALCEATLAPLAVDREALQRRCAQAARLLGESQEQLELHLHPDDIASLDPQFAAGWTIVPEPGLQRGTVQIEGSEAGVLDGPAEWRAALEAAIAC